MDSSTATRPNYRLIILVILTVLVILAGAGFIYLYSRKVDPETAFNQAIRSSLASTSLTCTTLETANDVSTEQATSLNLIGSRLARAVTTIKQSGSSIRTEEISTDSTDFVRYIAASSTGDQTAVAKFKRTNVLNVWSQAPVQTASTPPLFSRTTLGGCVVPIGHLQPTVVDSLATQLQKLHVFVGNLAAAKATTVNGQAAWDYTVAVSAEPYITFMKQFAAASNLPDLSTVDPATYAAQPPQNFSVYVSQSHPKILRIVNSASKRSVTFSDYDYVQNIAVPRTYISVDELQKRLNAQ